jgi:hypothetical protein
MYRPVYMYTQQFTFAPKSTSGDLLAVTSRLFHKVQYKDEDKEELDSSKAKCYLVEEPILTTTENWKGY